MNTTLKKIAGYFYPHINALSLEKEITEAYEKERYSEVIELSSLFNWQKTPFSSKVASCFLFSCHYKLGSEKNAISELADTFLNFYGEAPEKQDFECVKALIIEKKGDAEFKVSDFDKAKELFDIAITWVKGSDYASAIKRISTKQTDCLIRKSKKTEDDAISTLNRRDHEKALELFEKALSIIKTTGNSAIEERLNKSIASTKIEWEKEIERQKKARKERVYFLSKSLTEFPELSAVINALSKNGIESVADLSNRSNVEIDKIRTITPDKMETISNFKSKHNL
jgi:tetratricopeptide (TPR) repeat protein